MHNATHRSNSNAIGPTPSQQAAKGPQMRLRITETLNAPALYVEHEDENVLVIYADPDGRVWGDMTTWYTRADGSRYPLSSARLNHLQALFALRTLLAGLDFAGARAAREIAAS